MCRSLRLMMRLYEDDIGSKLKGFLTRLLNTVNRATDKQVYAPSAQWSILVLCGLLFNMRLIFTLTRTRTRARARTRTLTLTLTRTRTRT